MRKSNRLDCRKRIGEQEVAEKIITTEYSEGMQRSYMNYSMSVITARAIPDARFKLNMSVMFIIRNIISVSSNQS